MGVYCPLMRPFVRELLRRPFWMGTPLDSSILIQKMTRFARAPIPKRKQALQIILLKDLRSYPIAQKLIVIAKSALSLISARTHLNIFCPRHPDLSLILIKLALKNIATCHQ
jgi:hypothetical protein